MIISTKTISIHDTDEILYSPSPNHSVATERSTPEQPYATPTIALTIHSALMFDTLISVIWEIMNNEDTIHELYARRMWKWVRMKSETRLTRGFSGGRHNGGCATY